MAGRALRSVRHITDTARRVAASTLHERIALDGPQDELKELAATFDSMLKRLDGAFDAQRRFAASASHELRTPLATNRCLVDVSDIAAGAVEETAGEAAAAGVTVDAEPDPAPTNGDTILLERLALNLVRNGVRHNHPGGWVTVSTRVAAGPGQVELVVSNSGPPVPPEQVGSLFEPFRRLGRTTRLIPALSAQENVETGLVPLGVSERHARAARALENVGLAERGAHLPSELSGGQQQRVALVKERRGHGHSWPS